MTLRALIADDEEAPREQLLAALKQAWPEVDLQIVPDGGHLFTEPGITDGLVRAADRFAGKTGA